MAQEVTKVWTRQITSADQILITSAWGITKLSIILVSGSGSIKGGITINTGSTTLESQTIELIAGIPITYEAKGGTVLDDITITLTSGDIHLTGTV